MSFNGFVRREVEGVPFYSCSALEDLKFLRHGFSTRHGGVSPLPAHALNLGHVSCDSAERVEENRRRFMAALHLQTACLTTLSQIHSDRVHIIEENPSHWNRRTQGDALITQQAGVALAIQVADCFPILIADPETRTIAGVHAGWRGCLLRVGLRTAQRMRERFGCDPKKLRVAIGPGIQPCCFEVGSEVADAFKREYPCASLVVPRAGVDRKYLLDLKRALDIQFEEAGFSRENIFDLGACTRCRQDEFFSFRGEGTQSGRMMGVIALL